jgi:hypothetical protein
MCQPKSKGGQRCAAHTRPQYMKVLRAIQNGNDEQAAAEATKGFTSVRDYAMTKEGPAVIQSHINAIEEHYFSYPSRSIEQETARQTMLANLRGALDQGDQRKTALGEARAAIKDAEQPLDVDGAVKRVAAREAAQEKAAAEARAAQHGWALTAHTIDMKTDALDQAGTKEALEALQYRLENTLPGEEFTVSAFGDTMTVAYDEKFDTFTGKTQYVLRTETPTSFSETTFISRDHITADVNKAVFNTGAWTERRTLSNPKVAGVFAKDYDDGIAEAAKAHTTDFDTFSSEYARLYEAAYPSNHAQLDAKTRAENAVPLNQFVKTHQRAFSAVRSHHRDHTQSHPSPADVTAARTAAEVKLAENGVATYLSLAAADEQAMEKARVQHRAAVTKWNAEQEKRQESALRRMLPASPPPTMPHVERKTTPHPFGHMTRDEWVKYETENLQVGRTDLSEFSTHRGKAPAVKDPYSYSGTILDTSGLFARRGEEQVA